MPREPRRAPSGASAGSLGRFPSVLQGCAQPVGRHGHEEAAQQEERGHQLGQAVRDELKPEARIINITSDAAVEPYEGWGAYGASKAALDQLTAILGAEQPGLAVYAFDPGDMRTAMHQAAFPGEDISDRPEPATVVPALLALLEQRPPSGRYTASQLADRAPVTAGGGSG
jgi:NAD(P)-dependent dehydrogenase (short-subunit alcohol dehydrogenase family)